MKTIYVSLLLFIASLSSSEDQSLILTHSYPQNRNFNQVKLTCLRQDSVTVFPNETRFLLNDTMDLKDVKSIDVLDYQLLKGEITFIFGQKQEGLFSCSMGSKSSNHIGLAGILLIHVNYLQVDSYSPVSYIHSTPIYHNQLVPKEFAKTPPSLLYIPREKPVYLQNVLGSFTVECTNIIYAHYLNIHLALKVCYNYFHVITQCIVVCVQRLLWSTSK